MEPVNIEFLMKDNLTPGINGATGSIESMGKTAAEVDALLKSKMKEQRSIIKGIESDLKQLEKQYSKMSPGSAQSQMRAEIDAARQALQEEKAVLSQVEGEHDKVSGSAKRLSMRLRELQDAMAKMRIQGQSGSEAYRHMASEAAELSDTIGDLRSQTTILADDNAGLKGVVSGVNGISGAFAAATGVMGVFASENETLNKIQTRVQSAMAITIGLQQVANTLNKDSAFRLVTVTRAKEMLRMATNKLSVSLGISTVAAQALMGALTLGLSVAIGAIVVAFENASKSMDEMSKSVSLLKIGIKNINDNVDFDIRIKEACGASKKELLYLRLAAAQTAEQLANTTYTKISAKHPVSDAAKEALKELNAARDKVLSIKDDIIIENLKSNLEKTRKKVKEDDNQDGSSGKKEKTPFGTLKYWEEVISKLKEAEKNAVGENAIIAIRKQLSKVEAEYNQMLQRINNQTIIALASHTNQILQVTLDDIDVQMTDKFGNTEFENAFGNIDTAPLHQLVKDMDKLEESSRKSKMSSSDFFKSFAEKAQFAAQMMGELSTSFYELGEATGNAKMQDAASWIDSIGSVLNTFAQAIQSGNAMGVIQAGIAFISNTLSASSRHIQKLNEIKSSLEAVRYEYTMLQLQQQSYSSEIFGTDNLKAAIDALNIYESALLKLSSMMQLYGTSDRIARSSQAGSLDGLKNIQVVTGHAKSGLFGWGKGRDVYSSIMDAYPQIVDANKNLNVELAQSILSSAKLDERSKTALQHMVDLANEAKEAYSQLNDYLTGLFGSLGTDMMSIITDATIGGTEAIYQMGDAASKVTEKMINDMVYSAIFGKMFQKAGDDITALWNNSSLSDKDRMKESMDIISALLGSATGSIDEAYKLIDYAKDQASEHGLDLYSNKNSQSGRSGAFSSMTMDQGTRLEGMFTAGQMHWQNIDENTLAITRNASTALDRLSEISRNTSYCQHLEQMQQDISYIKRDGIKMK